MIDEPKYEYLLHWWGECEARIKEKWGYDEYLWFDTEEKRNTVRKNIVNYADKNHWGYVTASYQGYLTRKQTIACMVWNYRGRVGYLEYNFGYGFSTEDAMYMFEEGNYNCDCNLSSFISEKYKDFPELECGDEIVLENLWGEFRESNNE